MNCTSTSLYSLLTYIEDFILNIIFKFKYKDSCKTIVLFMSINEQHNFGIFDNCWHKSTRILYKSSNQIHLQDLYNEIQ